MGQEGRADMAEEAFDLAATARLVGPGVDQGDVERGADDLQVVGAEGGAVVAVEPSRQAAAQQSLLEGVLEAGGILDQVEGGKRHHARCVVEEGVEVGLAAVAPARHQQARTVHQSEVHRSLTCGKVKATASGSPVDASWAGAGLGGEEAVHGAA